MVPVAGIDGCKAGWVVVYGARAFVCPRFATALAALPDETVVAVDIPIGLLDHHRPGGRAADQAARARLGPRASSVFSPPNRPALGATTLTEARARGGRLTLQALNILPKIEEVDRVMTPMLQGRVFEVHPELSFGALNGGQPLDSRKRSYQGREERRSLLEKMNVPVPSRPAGAAEDDLLDACALTWSARRIAKSEAERVPERPPRDRRGLRMEICW